MFGITINLIFADQRFYKFQLDIEYFRNLFWTVEFYRNENRGEGMNISGFSQTSPKIQFRALHSVRGRENSHISYIGDNFFRSQIAPLYSFHIYRNFCQYWNMLRKKERIAFAISKKDRKITRSKKICSQ